MNTIKPKLNENALIFGLEIYQILKRKNEDGGFENKKKYFNFLSKTRKTMNIDPMLKKVTDAGLTVSYKDLRNLEDLFEGKVH